jgi:hypothetical protein
MRTKQVKPNTIRGRYFRHCFYPYGGIAYLPEGRYAVVRLGPKTRVYASYPVDSIEPSMKHRYIVNE